MDSTDLFSSKTQAKILVMLSHSNNLICIQEILQSTKIGTRSLYLALARLERHKIVQKRSIGKEVRYKLNQASAFYQTFLNSCNPDTQHPNSITEFPAQETFD